MKKLLIILLCAVFLSATAGLALGKPGKGQKRERYERVKLDYGVQLELPRDMVKSGNTDSTFIKNAVYLGAFSGKNNSSLLISIFKSEVFGLGALSKLSDEKFDEAEPQLRQLFRQQFLDGMIFKSLYGSPPWPKAISFPVVREYYGDHLALTLNYVILEKGEDCFITYHLINVENNLVFIQLCSGQPERTRRMPEMHSRITNSVKIFPDKFPY